MQSGKDVLPGKRKMIDILPSDVGLNVAPQITIALTFSPFWTTLHLSSLQYILKHSQQVDHDDTDSA